VSRANIRHAPNSPTPCWRPTTSRRLTLRRDDLNQQKDSVVICSSYKDNDGSEMPWEVLGVSPSADEKEIKRAHRKLVLQHHPDRVGGLDDTKKHSSVIQKRFMKIQEAYELLMGRRHGPLGSQEQARQGFSFHDFFWSFNYHRRKMSEQNQQKWRPPPPPPGSWRDQMVNLKRRAAARRWKEERARRQRAAAENDAKEQYSSGIRAFFNGTSGSKSEAHTVDSGERPEKAGAGVSSQLEGLKRRSELKKRILSK
jgi:hypothetical protein